MHFFPSSDEGAWKEQQLLHVKRPSRILLQENIRCFETQYSRSIYRYASTYRRHSEINSRSLHSVLGFYFERKASDNNNLVLSMSAFIEKLISSLLCIHFRNHIQYRAVTSNLQCNFSTWQNRLNSTDVVRTYLDTKVALS
jgi:hypothetical protein